MSIFQLPGAPVVDRHVVGGKAWSIHRMQTLGIPVPPAFVIGTDVCNAFYREGQQLPAALQASLPDAMRWLEQASGKTFGGGELPLLVSVRSGAAVSMPGMMDTVLNLGFDDGVQQALFERTGRTGFAADARARFEEQYHKIVGTVAPREPWQQLLGAIAAVFSSWSSPRAIAYRKRLGLSDDAGTAVTVQAMVFGNLDDRSGTGVLFSRDPIDGKAVVYGEWLTRGQGEEVVSGARTPEGLDSLEKLLPEAHRELMAHTATLEQAGRDIQDIEFTVEAGKLWLLQSRGAKRTAEAAVRVAVALQREGLITVDEALERLTPEQIRALESPHIDPHAQRNAPKIGEGKPACPGVVSGVVVTDVDEAESRALDGESVILARPTTDPNDVHAMSVVAGVLTELGGATSHAAVVSREIGVPCIVGCGQDQLMAWNQRTVTIDATSGAIYDGALPVVAAKEAEDPDLQQLLTWLRHSLPDAGDRALADLLAEYRSLRA